MFSFPRSGVPLRGVGTSIPAVLSKMAESLTISRAFRKHRLPLASCFCPVAAFRGKRGQVSAREMAIDPLIDACEFLGTRERENSSPAPLGFARFAVVPMHHGLSEPQLGVVRIEREPLGTAPQGGGVVSLHLVCPCDECEQLARDGIGRRRPRQALLQEVECFVPVGALDCNRTEIE